MQENEKLIEDTTQAKSWLKTSTSQDLLEIQTYILKRAKKYTTRKIWTFVICSLISMGSVAVLVASAHAHGQLASEPFSTAAFASGIGVIAFVLLSDLWKYPRRCIASQYEKLLYATTLEARASCLYTLGYLIELDTHEFFDTFHVRYWDCLIGTHYE